MSGSNPRMRALPPAMQADGRRPTRHGGRIPAKAHGTLAEIQPGGVIATTRADEHPRLLAAEKGAAVPCDLLRDTWAGGLGTSQPSGWCGSTGSHGAPASLSAGRID